MQSVVLYKKPNCSYCNKAENLLSTYNINYDSFMLDVDFKRDWLVEEYPVAKTFPVVVVDGFFLGGFTELNEYVNNQKLILG